MIGMRRGRKYSFRLSFDDSTSLHEFDSTKNADLPFFDLSAIAAATDNFSDANKLGQGGFGSVYKVAILASLTSTKFNSTLHFFNA